VGVERSETASGGAGSAVNDVGCAADEGGFVGGEEEDGVGYLLGTTDASHGVLQSRFLESLGALGATAGLGGVDGPGDYTVDADALGGVLAGDDGGEVDDADLADVVGEGAGPSVEACGGGDVDDCSAAVLEHDGDGGLAGEEGALEVGVHDQVPLALLDVHQGRCEHEDGGEVDEHVHPAESFDGGVNHVLDLVPLGNIDGNDVRIGGYLLDHGESLLSAVHVAVGDHDLCALFGEPDGRGAAHARGASGQDCNFAS